LAPAIELLGQRHESVQVACARDWLNDDWTGGHVAERLAAGARARRFALVRAEAARVGIAACTVAERRDPRIPLRHLFGVTDVEHRGALRSELRFRIEGAEQAVPHEVRDAEIALLIVEMMSQVVLLDMAHEGVLRRGVEMLHAVAELVEQ